MDKTVKQIQALMGEVAGYVDALRVEAESISAKAAQLVPLTQEVDAVTTELAEKRGELANVQRLLSEANEAHRRLLALLQQA